MTGVQTCALPISSWATLKKLKEMEAAGADDGVFAAFAKANAGNAQDIVQGFLQRNRAPSTSRSPASTPAGDRKSVV